MANPITLGYSPLSGNIYAGHSKQVKGAAEGVRQYTGVKFDVTRMAIECVMQKAAQNGNSFTHEVPGYGRFVISVELIAREEKGDEK